MSEQHSSDVLQLGLFSIETKMRELIHWMLEPTVTRQDSICIDMIRVENQYAKIQDKFKEVERLFETQRDTGTITIDDIHLEQTRLDSRIKILEQETEKRIKNVEIHNTMIQEKIKLVEDESHSYDKKIELEANRTQKVMESVLLTKENLNVKI